MVSFKVLILGSNSAIPTLRRQPTSQLLIHNEQYYLIDCAEGTQLQLRKYKYKFQRINHIFISHLHGDHYFGLIGLINSMHLMGRKDELHIYADPQLKSIIDMQLNASKTELKFPLKFHPIQPEANRIIFENERIEVSIIPLKHRIPTCGFFFKEKLQQPRIDKTFIEKYHPSPESIRKIKNGGNFTDDAGHILSHESVTLKPPDPRSYAYCSDTAYHEEIIPLLTDVNCLYHEATFMHDLKDIAREKFHSTTIDAASIANKAGVKKLLIGHFSTRYKEVDQLEKEACTVFKNTKAVKDGDLFIIDQ